MRRSRGLGDVYKRQHVNKNPILMLSKLEKIVG
jgi:hypothetical protein